VVPLSTGELAVHGLGVVAPGTDAAPEPGWFDAAAELPGRGLRRLPPASQYLLAAAARAVADAGGRWAGTDRERRAAVVATNNAGAALTEELDRTIIRAGAKELWPSLSPYSTMSSFAGRLSIEQGITGFTLTVNSPATAGIEALQIAARAVAVGRAATVLVAATEETLSPAQSAGRASQTGAAVLCCSAAGPRYGTCRARSAFLAAADCGPVLARLLGEDPPDRIEAVVEDSAIGAAVARWLDRVPGCEVAVVPVHGGCLTPLLQVAARLAEEHPAPVRRAVLAASAEGTLALAELTVTPRPPALTGTPPPSPGGQ
jgi:3-oxoacyl-[acyl-carrier-protein] synthase II